MKLISQKNWRLIFCNGFVPYVALLLMALWLVGCSGHNNPAYNMPPVPLPAAFTVNSTPNYYTLYSGVGNLPANSRYQFTSAQYPLQVSYTLEVANPTGFDLLADTEAALQCWAKADPRVCAVSGVEDSQANLHVILCDTISSQTIDSGIAIGLTTIDISSTPSFTVQIATQYNDGTNVVNETPAQIEKTLCHELGHTLGLGHSPNPPDLMYYLENNQQGTSFANFLTYADAITLWTTLNAQSINWVSSRPTITPAQPQVVSTAARHIPTAGIVVDIYRP